MDLRFANVSVSAEMVSLLETTANRLALALENARLLEELQIRAGQRAYGQRGFSQITYLN